MKKKLIIALLFGIGALSLTTLLKRYNIYFTDNQFRDFISYLLKKDRFIGVSNLSIWSVTVAAIVLKMKEKKEALK